MSSLSLKELNSLTKLVRVVYCLFLNVKQMWFGGKGLHNGNEGARLKCSRPVVYV